jgi:hypothetical protein
MLRMESAVLYCGCLIHFPTILPNFRYRHDIFSTKDVTKDTKKFTLSLELSILYALFWLCRIIITFIFLFGRQIFTKWRAGNYPGDHTMI